MPSNSNTDNPELSQGMIKKLTNWLTGRKEPLDLDKETESLPPQDFADVATGDREHFLKSIMDSGMDLDEFRALYQPFPSERFAKYREFDRMEKHFAISAALDYYINTGLSSKVETGEILTIEATGERTKEVEELKSLERIFNKHLTTWMYGCIKNGVSYVQPEYKQGEGIVNFRYDFYTRPDMIKEYTKGGTHIGYLHKTQWETTKKDRITLLPLWHFISFKMPSSDVERDSEPQWQNKFEFDIASGAMAEEDPIESQDYGRSMIEKAYRPWQSVVRAMVSLDIARENAGKKERFVVVNVGVKSMIEQAKYFGQFLKQLVGKKRKREAQQNETGSYTTVETTVLPSQGEVNIHTEVNSPDIAHVEDVKVKISALAGALGIDKSLLGFTEDMSGGLGEGGWNQVSLAAASKAQSIRMVAAETLTRLCELHLFWKNGAIYEDGKLPFKITFHSTTTAIEQESIKAQEQKVNQSIQEITVRDQLDPNKTIFDQVEFARLIFVGRLGMDGEVFEKLLAPKPSDNTTPPTPPVFDSVMDRAEVKGVILDILTEAAEMETPDATA